MSIDLLEKIVNSDWFKEKSKIIQDAVLKYPPGTVIVDDENVPAYVIGYSEPDSGKKEDVLIIFSLHSPFENYPLACEDNFKICITCIDEKVGNNWRN